MLGFFRSNYLTYGLVDVAGGVSSPESFRGLPSHYCHTVKYVTQRQPNAPRKSGASN